MSTGTDALIAFLKARLAEDEQAARAWPEDQASWQAAGHREVRYDNGASEGFSAIDVSGRPVGWWERIRVLRDPGGLAAHIALHDPARVLREVEAKRRILAEHGSAPDPCDAHDAGFCTIPCDTLLLLAFPYTNHPEYRQEWRV